MTQDELIAFIHQHNLGVISTLGAGSPESAAIEFANRGLELVFDTHTTSRKYQNIAKDPHVSFVIGWEERKTVQYEGVAEVLAGQELEDCQEVYFEKNPAARKWALAKDIAFLRIQPVWIRYTDLNVYPWKIEEFSF